MVPKDARINFKMVHYLDFETFVLKLRVPFQVLENY